MADTARHKDPLEIAAASPDPAVRGMALRRRALEQEAETLDFFFSLYSGETGDGTADDDPLTETVAALLRKRGPLGLADLYAAYAEGERAAGREPLPKESFRVALYRRSRHFGRVSEKDRRYALVVPG